jgi:hypothetical protein
MITFTKEREGVTLYGVPKVAVSLTWGREPYPWLVNTGI